MKLRELLSQMREVQQRINVPPLYICGGVARSRYMGNLNDISDIDMTNGDKSISYFSEEFGKYLRQKYNATLKRFDDHNSIFVGNLKLDFSSNFNIPGIQNILKNKGIKDPSNLLSEVYSRDFTCNSLLLSLDLKDLIDLTNQGFKDIKNKLIKTCLDPKTTLTSNKNRVIRSIYLATKLNFNIDKSIIDFVAANPQTINLSSKKALVEKLDKAFSKDPDRASYYVTKMNLWKYIPITEIVTPYYKKTLV